MSMQKDQLVREYRLLLRRLAQLSLQSSVTKRRSVSESSASTISSTNSSFSLGTSPFSVSETGKFMEHVFSYPRGPRTSPPLLIVYESKSFLGQGHAMQ